MTEHETTLFLELREVAIKAYKDQKSCCSYFVLDPFNYENNFIYLNSRADMLFVRNFHGN